MELLWEKNLLGNSTPQSLLDTTVFSMVNILICEAGKKITNYTVRYHPIQIKVVENLGEYPHLVYTEDQSKKLIDLKESRAESRNPKLYILHHENLEQPNCCFVRLFKLYSDLCPKDCAADSLYLQPLPKPRADCWYS